MKNIASALVKAQQSKDHIQEAKLLKQWADMHMPIKRVNASSVSPMPDRFFQKLIFGASDCWSWRGSVDQFGYGNFPFNGESRAHRVSYRLFSGNIPAGKMVLHKCDNRQCVNPDHLFIGTQQDNMQDMAKKGRGKYPRLFGSKNPMAKLTENQVSEIRAMVASGKLQKEACQKYGVSPMTVSRIIRNEAWK